MLFNGYLMGTHMWNTPKVEQVQKQVFCPQNHSQSTDTETHWERVTEMYTLVNTSTRNMKVIRCVMM